MNITRWVLGVFLLVLSVAGFSSGDTGLAIGTVIIALLLLPPVAGFFSRKNHAKTVANQAGAATITLPKQDSIKAVPQTPAIVLPLVAQEKPGEYQAFQQVEMKEKRKRGGIVGWFQGAANSITSAAALESCIKSFPSINPKKLESLLRAKDKWAESDKDFISQRLIDKYHKHITADNVDVLGVQYLDFYKKIFPERSGQEIMQKINVHKVEAFLFTKVNDDEALDPGEIQEIITYGKSLGVTEFDTPDRIRRDYDYYITNWELDKGLFRGVPSDFMMSKNELCIFCLDDCELLEKKTVTVRRNYGGMSYRVRIAKGISYNMGSYRTSSEKETVEVSKGRGLVNVTTKRIIFKGKDGVVTIQANAIVDIEPFEDAVTVHKTTGKPFIFKTREAFKLYKYIRSAVRCK